MKLAPRSHWQLHTSEQTLDHTLELAGPFSKALIHSTIPDLIIKRVSI